MRETLCKAENHEGKWGFWWGSIDEAELLRLTGTEERTMGGFIHPAGGIVLAKAIGSNRRSVVEKLNKTRIFYVLPDVTGTWNILWVGHVDCFPFNVGIRRQMIAEGFSGHMVACYHRPDAPPDVQFGVAALQIADGAPIPMTICCDSPA